MRPEIARLFGEGRNYPTLATTMDDGAPHAVSIWSGVEDDHIVFFTSPTSRKGRNIARDPRVVFSCVNFENPYITGRVRGRVVDHFDGGRAMEMVDRISQRYIGAPFTMRDSTLYVVEVTHEEYNELPFQEPPSGG
jgi:PPOX class probable F420-dependent enzyme